MLEVTNKDGSVTIYIDWKGETPPPRQYDASHILVSPPIPMQQSVAGVHIFHHAEYGVNRIAASRIKDTLERAIELATKMDLEAYGYDWAGEKT